MLTRPGPFYIIEIAWAVARRPGRTEVDLEEAYRITDDIAEWYLRGELGDDEVVAQVGPPPILRSLAELKEDAQRRGEIWCLSRLTRAEHVEPGITGPAREWIRP